MFTRDILEVEEDTLFIDFVEWKKWYNISLNGKLDGEKLNFIFIFTWFSFILSILFLEALEQYLAFLVINGIFRLGLFQADVYLFMSKL